MDTLRRCELIKSLDNATVEKLLPVFVPLEKDSGTEIFSEGDEGDGLYVLDCGLVRATKKMPRGHNMIVALFHGGDVFGEMALITKSKRSAACVMEEAGKIWHLPGEAFLELKESEPRVHTALVRAIGSLVSNRLKSMTAEMSTLLRELSYTKKDMEDLREQVVLSKCGFMGFLGSLVGGRGKARD